MSRTGRTDPMTGSLPLILAAHRGTSALLFALVGVLAAISALAMVMALTASGLPVTAANDDASVTIEKVRTEAGLVQGDLRSGDRIVAVNDIAVRDRLFFLHLSHSGQRGDPIRLTVARDGIRRDVAVAPIPGLNPRWPTYVPLWLCIVVSWAVVAILLWKRPGDPQVARIATVAGIGLAVIAIRNPLDGWMGESARIAWVTTFIVLSGVMCSQFLHFCARYPVRITLPRWVLPLAYGIPAVLTTFALIVFRRCLQEGGFLPLWAVVRALFGFNAVLVVAGFVLLLRTYSRALAADRRQQVRWVVFGLVAGLAPQTLLVVLPRALGAQPLASEVLVQSFLLLAPMGFFASFLRYRLFDVDLIFGRGTVIGLLAMAVVLLRAAVAAALDPETGGGGWPLRESALWAGSALAVGVPALAFRRRLERPLGVPGLTPSGMSQAIEVALAAGGECEERVVRLLTLLAERLRIERAAAFLADGSGTLRCTALLNCRAVVADQLRVDASGSLAAWLTLERRPVRLRTYDRPLGADLLHPDERTALERLDAAVVAPVLTARGLEALLVLSNHVNGTLPNSVAVHSVGEAAGRLARALEQVAAERETVSRETSARQVMRRGPVSALETGVTEEAAVPVETRSHLPRRAREGYAPRDGGPAAPRQIGPYRLNVLLGSGSSGEVWGAVHEPSGTRVALKRLHARLGSDMHALRRFMQEVAALGRVDDPYVVRILDYGNAEGIPWFAMEWIEGESLRERMKRQRPLPVDQALEIAAQAARGLHACHRAGLVHRDVAPANILLSGARARIADLGVAHQLPDPGAPDRSTAVAGTILYMSPEQVTSRRLGPGSDLFSLGSVLYECLAGRAPFEAESLVATIDRIASARYRPLAQLRPGLSADVAGFVESLLSRDPEDRPPTALAAARALERASRRVAAAA